MVTPKINENCYYVQNDSHRCKIELEKFHFDVLCAVGELFRKVFQGGGIPPGEIGLIVHQRLDA